MVTISYFIIFFTISSLVSHSESLIIEGQQDGDTPAPHWVFANSSFVVSGSVAAAVSKAALRSCRLDHAQIANRFVKLPSDSLIMGSCTLQFIQQCQKYNCLGIISHKRTFEMGDWLWRPNLSRDPFTNLPIVSVEKEIGDRIDELLTENPSRILNVASGDPNEEDSVISVVWLNGAWSFISLYCLVNLVHILYKFASWCMIKDRLRRQQTMFLTLGILIPLFIACVLRLAATTNLGFSFSGRLIPLNWFRFCMGLQVTTMFLCVVVMILCLKDVIDNASQALDQTRSRWTKIVTLTIATLLVVVDYFITIYTTPVLISESYALIYVIILLPIGFVFILYGYRVTQHLFIVRVQENEMRLRRSFAVRVRDTGFCIFLTISAGLWNSLSRNIYPFWTSLALACFYANLLTTVLIGCIRLPKTKLEPLAAK